MHLKYIMFVDPRSAFAFSYLYIAFSSAVATVRMAPSCNQVAQDSSSLLEARKFLREEKPTVNTREMIYNNYHCSGD